MRDPSALGLKAVRRVKVGFYDQEGEKLAKLGGTAGTEVRKVLRFVLVFCWAFWLDFAYND